MAKYRKTQSHTGGAQDHYVVRKDKTAVDPNPAGNRAERRAAAREGRKKGNA